MLTINGSMGEGGGQVLRSSLSLSLVTGTPFHIIDIRKRRQCPGLRRQHLTAVRAAAKVSRARVEGDEIGSQELTFVPRSPVGGDYRFAIGTAGSTTLVLQTILPALILAPGSSTVVLEGGTHNPRSPSFDFLTHAYLPLVRRMGPVVSARLECPGFYPAGGGRFTAVIEPAPLRPLELLQRGPILDRTIVARVANLPRHIAERELDTLATELRWNRSSFGVEELIGVSGPGNVIVVILRALHVTEVFTGFGQKGVRAEAVARRLATRVREYSRANVPVGRHLADQLSLLIAIAKKGAFRTLSPSSHLTTQVEVIRRFLGIDVHLAEHNGTWTVSVDQRAQVPRPGG